jgi:hypothetical protein
MDKSESACLTDMAINVYMRIFTLFTNVTHLDFISKDDYRYPPLSLYNLPSTTCSSSTIVHLSISLLSLEDCLCLLDGRLTQLHTFIVQIHHIGPSIDGHLDETVKLLSAFKTVSFPRSAVRTKNCKILTNES